MNYFTNGAPYLCARSAAPRRWVESLDGVDCLLRHVRPRHAQSLPDVQQSAPRARRPLLPGAGGTVGTLPGALPRWGQLHSSYTTVE